METPGKYCPRCGSPNIGWVLPQTWSNWKCRECGYTGGLIIEHGEFAGKIREKFEEEKE